MRHHTKDKGDIGVLHAATWFIERDYLVSQPMTEHAPFDLIVHKGDLFWRIQVKYRQVKNGLIYVSLFSSWADRNGTHNKAIDKSKVDAYCVYEPVGRSCYFFSPRELANTTGVSLRMTPVKNNQSNGVRMALDCTEMKPEWAANFGSTGAVNVA